MSNKQRTQLHTNSIISKAHKHHKPKYGTMGSVATGYDNDGDDDGDVRDDNDATRTMATAHQAGYYAHLIRNWKNMWQRRNGRQ